MSRTARGTTEDTDNGGSFADLLHASRLAAHLTQRALAMQARVSERSIQDLERGARPPRASTVRLLAEALNLDEEEQARFEHAARRQVAEGARKSGVEHPRGRLCAPKLPRQATRFIDRDRERAVLEALLVAGDVHLLTLVGTPGCGLTRLAVAVAAAVSAHFRNQVWFIDLSQLAEAEFVLPSIAQALDVRADPSRPLVDAVARAIGDARMLLVLDTFEHVLPAASTISLLLERCARLTVLATSRERLALRWERLYPLEPLALPTATDRYNISALERVPSIALFVERAQAVDPSFRLTSRNAVDVADICARLDGLPLAIELAAAHARALSPAVIAKNLAYALDVLPGSQDAPPRHRGLRAAIGWSHDRLDPAEKHLLRSLAVFADGCTMDAAEAVAQVTGTNLLRGLERLICTGLLRRDVQEDGKVRYAMLQTMRAFALEELERAGGGDETRARHAEFYLGRATTEHGAAGGPGGDWLREVERELNNVRGALSWAVEAGRTALALRLAISMEDFWLTHGFFDEGQQWLERALAATGEATSELRATALRSSGNMAWRRGDFLSAARYGEQELVNRRALNDQEGQGWALGRIASALAEVGDLTRAAALYEQALVVQGDHGEPNQVAQRLVGLSVVRDGLNQSDEALECLRRAEALFRLGGPSVGLAQTTGLLSLLLGARRGRWAEAEQYALTTLELARSLGDQWMIAHGLMLLGLIGLVEQRPKALRLVGAGQAILDRVGAGSFRTLRVELDQHLKDLRKRLGDAVLETELAHGRALSVHEALALAMPAQQPSPSTPPLTPREREVAALLAGGLSNRAIADRLVISERTAEHHVENILGKLGASSRTEVAIWAVSHLPGWVDPSVGSEPSDPHHG